MLKQKSNAKRRLTLSDTKLLQQITGYKTKTNYKLGIKKFVKWFKEFYS